MSRYTISYDFGTGSVKAALVDRDYTLVDYMVSYYPTYYPQPGWAEQHPEDYWESFIEVTQKLLSTPGVDSSKIRGLVFSQTSSAIIFVDRNTNSLYDCVTWVDGRADEEAEIINQIIEEKMASGTRRVHEKSVSAKLLWFIRNRPDVVDKAESMLDPAGYLFLKTTGQLAYEYTGANATRLFNKIERKWDERWFQLLDIPRRLIPDRIVDSSEIVGYVTEEAACLTGLRTGTPVVGGCSDNANGQLGSGSIKSGDVHMYMGTSGWLSITAELSKSVMPSAVPGMGYHYYCTNSVGSSIDWAILQLYREEKNRLGNNIYELVDNEINQRLVNHENILFSPWLYGEEAPVMDASVRGSLLNIQPTTCRGDIMRAIAEGIAFNFRWIKENHESQFGEICDNIILIGGVSQSKQISQILANIMNVTITTLKSHRFAGNVGLAACVDIALGDLKDFSNLRDLLHKDKVFHPDTCKLSYYNNLYSIYRTAYLGLNETYAELKKLSEK